MVSYYGAMSSDGGMRNFIEGLRGEALHESYRLLYKTANLPSALRPIISRILRLTNNHRLAVVNQVTGEKSAYQLQEITAKTLAYIDSFTEVYTLHLLSNFPFK